MNLVTYLLYDVWEEQTAPQMKGTYTSPAPLVPVVLLYLWFVLYFGPRFMKDRKPFDLGNIMKWYNYINIAVNGFLFMSAIINSRFTYDVWFCPGPNPNIPHEMILFAGQVYIGLKLFDLLDTVFFVLRKKWSQVTPLHVSHHVIMPFTAYIGLKLGYAPETGLVLILNTFVHVIMYYYYHLASLGQPVWWKKHITHIQLIQFYISFVHAAHTFFIPNCSYNRFVAGLQATESIYFIISFTRFYVKAYVKNK